MENILTDQLRLAQKIYAPGILFFRHRLQPLNDCDQIVFQGDRSQGIVSPNTPHEQQVKVRKDDVIIRIYFEPRMYLLTGTLSTKDRYKRIYELPLVVTISDPMCFAEHYFQKKDPAKQAIDTFKSFFERSATGIEYSRIQNFTIPCTQWNPSWKETGIHLELAGKTMFREDPKYNDPGADDAKLQEDVRKKQASLEAEKTIQVMQDKIQREHTQVQKDFERQEKTKEQIYTICYNLRQVAADEITTVLKERIHEGFESGRTPSEISDEYFALVGIFEDRTHILLENSIIAGMFVEGSLRNKDSADQEEDEPETTPDAMKTQ